VSAVMKAFGIVGRNPGTAEMEFMKKWFREYGFDSSLVAEACNRTIRATGAASFPYADKILSGWRENGVKVLRDVEEL
ncbi:primosomal replication protein N, partial [Klebsiella oxytoca]